VRSFFIFQKINSTAFVGIVNWRLLFFYVPCLMERSGA